MKKNRCFISGNQKGFSLLEAIVVIAIIVIMAAIGIPTYSRMLPDMRLRSAAQDMYSSLQTAKMNAIRTNSTSDVTFYPASGEKGTYRKANGTTVDLKEGYKDSVTYGRPDDTSNYHTFDSADPRAIFNQRGMATNIGEVFLMNAKNNSYKIQVLGSGVITLKKWNTSSSVYE